MSLQRSEQKGRKALFLSHLSDFLHCGQRTISGGWVMVAVDLVLDKVGVRQTPVAVNLSNPAHY